MYSRSISATALLFAALCAIANAWVLEVNTPQLTQCKSGYLSWTGKNAPFNVSIISQKTGDYLKSFGAITAQNYTWIVDLPSGRNVALKVIDAKGNINYSNGVYIKNSSVSSCVSATVDESTNATVSQIGLPGISGNATTAGVSSGGIGPVAAATTTNNPSSGADRLTAGLGLLLACAALALVA